MNFIKENLTNETKKDGYSQLLSRFLSKLSTVEEKIAKVEAHLEYFKGTEEKQQSNKWVGLVMIIVLLLMLIGCLAYREYNKNKVRGKIEISGSGGSD